MFMFSWLLGEIQEKNKNRIMIINFLLFFSKCILLVLIEFIIWFLLSTQFDVLALVYLLLLHIILFILQLKIPISKKIFFFFLEWQRLMMTPHAVNILNEIMNRNFYFVEKKKKIKSPKKLPVYFKQKSNSS